MPNNYEQEVCNILKETKIHQRLEELKERTNSTGHEHGFNVCSDGRVTEVIEGIHTGIDLSHSFDECNKQIDLQIHSHPYGGDTYPSKGDFISNVFYHPRIADCIYGSEDDKITCYNISDELRKGYIQKEEEISNKLNETRNKFDETRNKIHNATNREELYRLFNEFRYEWKKYDDLMIEIQRDIVSRIYPDINFISDSSGIPDDYDKAVDKERKFGNFGDVWIKDCGKI